MSGFQRGDKSVCINGKTYGLRLTMGALAEITSRLNAKGPQELSLRLRALNAAQGRVLLACVMRPYKDNAAEPAATYSDSDIAAAMPVICSLFEEAFLHDG